MVGAWNYSPENEISTSYKLGKNATITNRKSTYWNQHGIVATVYKDGYYAIRFFSQTLRTSVPIVFHETEFSVED